tara:strand:- start:4520 stop:4939 length:420 start_codon:yes stop_codon:yes gene_type:complete
MALVGKNRFACTNRKEKVMQISTAKPIAKPTAANVVKTVAKKEVKRKAATMFTFFDYTKIEKWDRAMPPQAKCIATTITKYGIQYNKPYVRKDIEVAMEKLHEAETKKNGKKWTRQNPYRIFAYYIKNMTDNKLLMKTK